MFTNIWKIMKEDKFEVDNEINKDLLCGICKCLMIKACNAPCGCHFCADCIERYLDGNHKFCPGTSKYCQVQLISFTKDVTAYHTANIKILESIVKCPGKNCQFKDQLSNIENHMGTCDKHPISCPFNAIGCEMNEVLNGEMRDHLNENNFCHSKLLIDLINNLRNEMNSMKNEMIELKREHKQKFDIMELKFTKQEEKICEMERKEMDNTKEIDMLNQEMVALKNDNRALREQMQTNVKSIKEIRQQIEANETKSQQQINELKQNYQQQRQQEENKIAEMEKCANEIRLIQTKLENVKLINYGLFEWRVENLSQKRNELIYSKPFYSGLSGYRMCLSVIRRENGIIYVGFHLMKGKFDDKLDWPFKCAVTIDVINPADGNVCLNETVKHSDFPDDAGWMKPSKERNDGIWVYDNYNGNFIPNNSVAIKDDFLQLKCKIDKL